MKNLTLLQELLINTAKKTPDKIALITDGKCFTYQYIYTQSVLFAKDLKQKGIKRGDRVVIQTGNSIYTIIAFWATLMMDAIASIIAIDIEDEKLIQILKNSDASFIIAKKISIHLKEIPELFNSRKIYLLEPGQFTPNFYHFSLEDNDKTFNDEFKFKNNELDLASIIYTSGSTGEPKGVMMTHRNMLSAVFSINQYLMHTENDVILCALPFSFDYGLYQMMMAFSVGACLVLEKDALFPAEILKKIQKHKVTVLPIVPTLFNVIAEHAKRFQYDYSSLRAVTNTGAFLSENQIEKIKNLFPGISVFSMYGLTECKRCTYLPPNDLHRKPNSVGIAIPNTELWIIDESGEKLGPGKIGQLVIRGATVMKGYWRNTEETEKKLKDGLLPGEKVLYTGDYAMQDEEGYLYFKGRMDDVIKFKGMKLSPVEIEKKLVNLPKIREAAVFDIDNNEDSQLIFCVTTSIKDHNELTNQIRCSLARAEQPSQIYILEKLPKNTNGKINKKMLKEKIKNLMVENYL